MYPYYQNMGMSYDEYWHGPLWLTKVYKEAYEQRLRQEEWARHRQGMYIMQALNVAISRFGKEAGKEKYPAEPWPVTQKEADERQLEREIKGYNMALAQRRAESAAELERRRQQELEQGVKDHA